MAHETDEEFPGGISPCTRIVDYDGPIEDICTRMRRDARASRAGPGSTRRTSRQVRDASYGAGIHARRKPRT